MITIKPQGRLGNLLLQNVGMSILSKRFDLKVQSYNMVESFKQLNPTFNQGSLTLDSQILVTDDKLMSLLNQPKLNNSLFYDGTFQVPEFIKQYKNEILSNFSPVYTYEENQVFVHVRLGDVENCNPGINYYRKALNVLNCSSGFISSDSPSHFIVKQIIKEFNLQLYEKDPISTINFAKNFENIVLSKGTFSWWIGMLSKSRKIFYPVGDKPWYGNIFVDEDWYGLQI